MRVPRMATRKLMALVAIAAVMAWGFQLDGFAALAWEIPALGYLLAWTVRKRRRMAAAVLAGTFLVWLIAGLGFGVGTVSLGVGHTDVRITFRVLDAETGQPVKAASIQLRDPDYSNFPDDIGPPYKIDLETGTDGSALLPLNLMFTDSVDAASGRLLSFHIRYPQWDIRVGRDGYEELKESFAAYERGIPDSTTATHHLSISRPPSSSACEGRVGCPGEAHRARSRNACKVRKSNGGSADWGESRTGMPAPIPWVEEDASSQPAEDQMRTAQLRIWWLMATVAGVAVLLSLSDMALTLTLPFAIPAALTTAPAVAAAPGHRWDAVRWASAVHPLLYVLWLAAGRLLLNPWQIRPTGSSDRLFYSLELPFAMALLACLYLPILFAVMWTLDYTSAHHDWPLRPQWPLPLMLLTWLIMLAVCWLDPFQLFVWFLD